MDRVGASRRRRRVQLLAAGAQRAMDDGAAVLDVSCSYLDANRGQRFHFTGAGAGVGTPIAITGTSSTKGFTTGSQMLFRRIDRAKFQCLSDFRTRRRHA